ncbi:MAG: hypothetical protein IT324_28450 [Anaerolineae bacterium]|nr:hypothetical protein [Anaerolineae bacterium]
MKNPGSFLWLVLVIVLSVPLLHVKRVHSQTAAPTAAATVEVAAEMGDMPTNCGPTPEPLQIDENVGPSIGSWPLWTVMYYQQDGVRKVGLAMPKDRMNRPSALQGWWSQKALWTVKLTYKGEVTLRGYNVADNSPIYWTLNNGAPTTSPVLNPEQPGAWAKGSDQWAFFPSYVWVSRAGCYVIEAQWNGGMWRQTIPVGYVEGF